MLEFMPVRPDDIDYIIHRLWERGREDASNHGFEDLDQVKVFLKTLGFDHGHVFRADGEPVVACGARLMRKDAYSTWFIATNRFIEFGKPITRYLRGFLQDQVRRHPGATLELISALNYPDAARWFKLLGFLPSQPAEGMFSRYEYQRS